MNRASGIIAVVGLAAFAWMAHGQTPAGQTDQPKSAKDTTITQPASAIPSDQQATRDQIKKMFEVMRLPQQMQSYLDMMPRMIKQQFQTQLKQISSTLPPGKRVMPQDQAALEKVMDKYMQKAIELYPVDEMLENAVPIYQRHISHDDADALIAFYSSPPGQHLLDQQPAIMQEYMQVVMTHMQDRTRRLTDEMTAEMQKLISPGLPPAGASTQKTE